MRSVGVRELRERASQILRLVQNDREEVDITYHGRVIARLVPAHSTPIGHDLASVWADLDQLAAEIGARWPAHLSAADAVSEQRRDL